MLVEPVRIFERLQITEELQLASGIGLPQCAEQAMAEVSREHFDGHEEVLSRADPLMSAICRTQSPASNDAVQMGVQAQVRSPGVKDGGDGGLSAEMFWIGCDREKRLGDAFEQQVIDQALVLIGELA